MALARLLDDSDSWSRLEADVARYYNRDLADVLYGDEPWCVRKVVNLVRNLPDESATVRSVTHGWSVAEELAAAQLEMTHALWTATLQLGGVKKPPPPLQVPRPHRPAPPKKRATADDLSRLFGGS